MFRSLRIAVRLVYFAALLAACGVDYTLTIRLRGRRQDFRARARWLQRWSRWILRGLGIRTQHEGTPPTDGLLVSNHLSYLDILVIGARQPVIFVSKAEVRNWPVLGWLTHCAGTLYVDRSSRVAAARMNEAMHEVLQSGLPVAFFPEGTSSGGDGVLPFHSALFGGAADNGWRVTPARVAYRVRPGSVSDDVAYWGDMTFFPHFLKLLGQESVEGSVRYATTLAPQSDRKVLAREAHAAVTALHLSPP